MQLSLPMKRLLWKDVRLILPLVLALIGVSLFIHVLFVFSPLNPSELDGLISVMLLVIPICYSIGAAAILISMEKESGQMIWLNGLPIEAYRVTASKLVVAIAAWMVVWLASIVIYQSIHVLYLKLPFEFPLYRDFIFRGFLWINVFQSLLLLSIGIMLAWRLQSTWVAVTGIFVVLLIAFHIQALVWNLVPDRPTIELDFARDISFVLVAIVCSCLFAWLGWRYANQYWSHELPKVDFGKKWTEIAQVWIPTRERSPLTKTNVARLSPVSALVWQSARQHGAILIALLGLVFAAAMMFVFLIAPASVISTVFTACAVSSWVGWLVFRNDISRSAVRFHAERGLRPSRLWWTLHCVPISFLCVMALLTVAVIRIEYPEIYQWSWLSIGILRQFQFLLLIYALSQWISFVIPKPVFAAVIAPLAATSLALYLYSESGPVYANVLIVSLLIALPLVVTRIFIRSWMDGQRNWRFWASQAGCFCLLLAIPQLPQLALLWGPSMPASARVNLTAEALALASQPQTSISFTRREMPAIAGQILRSESILADLRKILVDDSKRTNWEFRVATLTSLIGEIVSSRIQLLDQDKPTRFQNLDGTEISVSSAMLKDRYNESMGFLSKIVGIMRTSPKISAQDRSDWLEIFLLRECLQADSKELLVPSTYNQIINHLTDQAGRYQARRQAILLSWNRLRKNPTSLGEGIDGLKNDFNMSKRITIHLGGYELFPNDYRPLQNWLFDPAMRKADLVTYVMLECLEQGRKSNFDRDAMQKRIETAWSNSKYSHRDGFENDTQTVDKAEFYLPQNPMTRYFNGRNSNIPCDQWYGDWERVAAGLQKR